MNEVRTTSLKCYTEIKEEGIYDTKMQEVLMAIESAPFMTGREYATIVLGYSDMNVVRPRITDLKNAGYIREVGKRKCNCSGRTSYIWSTINGLDKFILKKLKFKQEQANMFVYVEDNITLYQDFRKGKRQSYAFDETGCTHAHENLEIHKKFKHELNKILNKEL